MGAWDASAFGNDAAMDWVSELRRHGASAVAAALAAAAEADEYLEAPEAEEAIAAAEVVAAASDQATADLPEAVQAWVQSNPGAFSTDDVRLALRAVDRAAGEGSELYELWVEDANDPEWSAAMADLRRRLERATP